MKKILFLLIGAQLATTANAQLRSDHSDSVLSRWVIDVNVKGGLLTQELNTVNTLGNYLNAVNSATGTLKFNNGYSIGGDLQLGYFFGHKRHFGVGAGISYFYQAGDISLSNYRVAYQANDFQGKVFRQQITANYLTEKQQITNINIPLVFKYKKRFSKRWGFTADAGALFNVQAANKYSTNASFNYEAVYKFTDATHTVYDNATTPDVGDYFITKDNYLKNNPGGNVEAYFNDLRSKGYNVGLNVKPANNSGKVSYTTGSVGLLLKPSANLFLSDKVALDFGLYFMYQPFKNNAVADYKVTDKTGDYTSMLGSVSSTNAASYGANVGVRFFLGGRKDRDHDGVLDKKDMCPDDSGSVLFQGCPDRDGDGIIDKNDSCPDIKGIAKFYGCPDTDNDGIQDKEDSCPLIKGIAKFQGCPDTDNDGIPDKDDACPDKAGPAKFQGCPDRDGDNVPDKDDDCPDVPGLVELKGCPQKKDTAVIPDNVDVSTPILFDVNKTSIKEESMPVLRKAAKELKAGTELSLTIDGFTDNTGADDYNRGLSLMRAAAVKRLLVSMGVEPKKVHIVGYGEEKPAATNNTREGRMKNRRAIMKLK